MSVFVMAGGIANGEARLATMEAKGAAFDASQALRARQFTVQNGGADPLFSYDASALPKGTIVNVADLGGCGADGAAGPGLCIWMGDWRRLSRGVTATLAPGTINLDAFRDPMKIAFNGSLVTTIRTIIARPYLGARWTFVRPGLSALTSALGVGLIGGSATNDVALVGPSVNFIEYVGSTLAKVDAE